MEWLYNGPVQTLGEQATRRELEGYPEWLKARVAVVEIGDGGRYVRLTLTRPKRS
jgi:hypothetical protein